LKLTGPTDRSLRAAWVSLSGARKIAATLGVLFLLFSLQSCRPVSQEPVTLTFLDPEWSHDLQERRLISDAALEEFTKETGIRVKHLPAPETSPAQLTLILQLLQKKAASPDVYGVDVVWPAILGNYLVDLKPYFATELSAIDPALVANYTANWPRCRIPPMGFYFIERIFCINMATRNPQKRGMNWRKWLLEFKTESAPKGTAISGLSCGPFG
jgi:hypothetical protein